MPVTTYNRRIHIGKNTGRRSRVIYLLCSVDCLFLIARHKSEWPIRAIRIPTCSIGRSREIQRYQFVLPLDVLVVDGDDALRVQHLGVLVVVVVERVGLGIIPHRELRPLRPPDFAPIVQNHFAAPILNRCVEMTVDDSSVGLRARRPVVSRIDDAIVVVDRVRRIIELIGRHHADRIAIRTVRIGEKSGHCHQCRQELRVRHIRQILGYRKRRGELDVVEMGRDNKFRCNCKLITCRCVNCDGVT